MTLKVNKGVVFFSFKILKEPILVQKHTVPHMKAPILSMLEPEGKVSGNFTLTSIKKIYKHIGDESIPPFPYQTGFKLDTFAYFSSNIYL